MSKVSEVYAEALFDLAESANAVEGYRADMKLVEDVLDSDASFVPFFSHVVVADEDKERVIDEAFGKSVCHDVLCFLKLLVKKRRIRYIGDIVRDFIDMCNEALGIEEGVVYTAFDLSESTLADLEKAIGAKEGKTVKLRAVKDDSLIGGVRVQIKTRVYDGSVKNQIMRLKNELLESR